MGNQLTLDRVNEIERSYYDLVMRLPLKRGSELSRSDGSDRPIAVSNTGKPVTGINPSSAHSELFITTPVFLLVSGILEGNIAGKLVELTRLKPDEQLTWCSKKLSEALTRIDNQARKVLSKIENQGVTITCELNNDFYNMMNEIGQMKNVINQVCAIRTKLKLSRSSYSFKKT